MFVFFNILNCRTTRRDSRGSGGKDSNGKEIKKSFTATKSIKEDSNYIRTNNTETYGQ